jgi:N-sulfoglucosamine sulfohydrolase
MDFILLQDIVYFHFLGLAVPMFIKAPDDESRRGEMTDIQANLLDIVPTVLDWFDIDYPKYHILKPNQPIRLTGKSLLPLLSGENGIKSDTFYGSHVTHEITMNYPMRTIIQEERYKLIHNLNAPGTPFPIDQDFYLSPTFLVCMSMRSAKKLFPHLTIQ